MSTPSSSQTASTWLANASLSSNTSMSGIVIPAAASTVRTASIGPTPMTSGATPVTADARIRARGWSPRSRARSWDITSTAAAPSLSGQAFPAVTRPSSRNAGRRDDNTSSDVSGRGPSSAVTASPPGTGTGVISRSNTPRSW